MSLQNWKGDASQVRPPKITWKPLKGYLLKNLEKDFVIADFERKPSSEHINKMVYSMLENQFYDTIMRVVERKAKPQWIVIDAQHRTQALKILHEKYGVEKYDIMLAIYENHDKAREIYGKLNNGKRLTAYDHSLAIDNGKIPFFNELRDYCYHYRNPDRMAFVDVLYAYNYARSGRPEGSLERLAPTIKKVQPRDLPIIKNFMSSLKRDHPTVTLNPIYRMGIFRPVLKIGMERNYTEEEFSKLFEKIEKHAKIIEISNGRRRENLMEIERLITIEILKERGV